MSVTSSVKHHVRRFTTVASPGKNDDKSHRPYVNSKRRRQRHLAAAETKTASHPVTQPRWRRFRTPRKFKWCFGNRVRRRVIKASLVTSQRVTAVPSGVAQWGRRHPQEERRHPKGYSGGKSWKEISGSPLTTLLLYQLTVMYVTLINFNS